MEIRPYRPDDAEPLADIWLAASLRAHTFISADYWQRNRARMVSEYLPNSETYVVESPLGHPAGFISLVGRHIAALFVHPVHQGHGYGSGLLKHAMQLYQELTLNVYADNADAVHFYEYHGFCKVSTQTDTATGAPEHRMRYCRYSQNKLDI